MQRGGAQVLGKVIFLPAVKPGFSGLGSFAPHTVSSVRAARLGYIDEGSNFNLY